MTGEHLWSEWMDRAKLLPNVATDYIETAHTTRRNTSISFSFNRSRQGSPKNKTIKVVCKNCNGIWMNKVENAVIPIITPLIKAQMVLLNEPMKMRLVEWISLKLLVAENNSYRDHPADALYSQKVREDFRAVRAIPDGLRIYIAMMRSAKWATGYNRHATGLGYLNTLLPPPKNPTAPKNVQAITWGIGNLLIYISSTTDSDISEHFQIESVHPMVQLWPTSNHDILWPPLQFVTTEFVDDLSQSLARFIEANSI